MPTAWESFPVEFKGGLVSNVNALQQGLNMPGSATFLQNYEPSKEGGYKKVTGYSKFSPNALTGTGPVLGVKVVNGSRVIAARKNGSDVTQYWTSTGTTWSSLGSAASLGAKIRSVSFKFGDDRKIMFVDGVNIPALYNVTTNTLTFPTLVSDATGASFIEVYKNAIFLAKGSNLIFSVPYDETDFDPGDGGGVINVGDDITGLIVFREELFIFSQNKIQRLVGNTSTDFQLVAVTQDLGCIYPDTIQEVGGDIMFMGPDGFRLLSATDRNGDFGLDIASSPISKQALTFINNFATFTSIVVREEAQYRVFAYATGNSVDASTGLLTTKFSDQGAGRMEWATLQGFKAYCADGIYVDAPAREVTIFAHDDGYVYEFDGSPSRDGRVISAVMQTPYIVINDPQKRKTLYKLALFVQTQGTFDVKLTIDYDFFKSANYNAGVSPPPIFLGTAGTGIFSFGSGDTVFGVATYGQKMDAVYDTPLIGSGKVFALRIEDNSINPPAKLDSVVFEYREHDRQ
jgi:hypothetical protein